MSALKYLTIATIFMIAVSTAPVLAGYGHQRHQFFTRTYPNFSARSYNKHAIQAQQHALRRTRTPNLMRLYV